MTASWLLDRVPPDSAVANAARRTLMAARVPRLARRSDPAAGALARALRTTALGRIPAEEGAWIERIERRRSRVDELALGIATICPFWSVPRIWGILQLRLVRELAPRTCLELGTGFGISAAYQAAALALNGAGRLVTLEREPRVVEIARETVAELGLESRVEQRVGEIGETLARVAPEIAPVDYAFVDAEHTERATVASFGELLPHASDGAVVVFDDISINAEMRRAWDVVRRNERVALELDLRRFGLVVIGARGAVGP